MSASHERSLRAGARIDFPAPPGAPEQVHVFAEEEVSAIRAARDAGRALLVRGEPGTGKTQLAKAAAKALGRGFVSYVVDSRSEARDLLWHVDAIRRLADAQVRGALRQPSVAGEPILDVRNYLEPRALWWAFDWSEAAKQAKRSGFSAPPQVNGCDPANGVVVLIDEIDKGESDVPNGLLEALGSAEFTPPGYAAPVRPDPFVPFPLVIITANEERVLPDAFVRRCAVLRLRLPENRQELIARLVERGKAHFPELAKRKKRLSESAEREKTLIEIAAELLVRDREACQQQRLRPLPGQAEFIDLLRVLDRRSPRGRRKAGPGDPENLIEDIARFIVRKHPDLAAPG